MEINKQFLQISVTTFVLTLVTQILSTVLLLVNQAMFMAPDVLTNFELMSLINYLTTAVSSVIAPIVLFIVFYFIGKNPNLRFELKPILSTLLIGNIVSLFVSSIIWSVFVTEILSVDYVSRHFVILILGFLAFFVFPALAGLSIGFIKRRNLTMVTDGIVRDDDLPSSSFFIVSLASPSTTATSFLGK